MRFINRLLVWTIVLNFFILIGAGHGVGWLGLIEFYVIEGFREGYGKLTLTGKFDDRVWTAAIVAAPGQIILFICLFIKPEMTKIKAIYIGLFLLFFSFLILTMNFFNSSLDRFPLVGSKAIPKALPPKIIVISVKM